MNTTTTTNTATPRGHKRERSDSSIEILSVRRVRQPKTEPSTPVPPPPEPSTPVPAPPPEPEPEERRRRHPFRRCPPAGFDKIWQRAQTESFTVLRRARCDEPDGCPREHFQLAGTTGNVYTIHVARELRCDCPWALKGNQCKHLVYILHGVLGARYELVYQRSLLKSELRAIFDKFAPPAPATDGGGGGGGGGRRRPVEGDCGICDTALGGGGDDGDGEEEEELVWCRARCGKNMHRACFRGWARAGATTCPLCRSPWQWTTRQGASATAAAAGVSTERAVQGEEGYLNVADQLGISSYRDDSEYQRRRARWEARMERMDRYYREFEDYDDEDEAEEDYDDEDEWED